MFSNWFSGDECGQYRTSPHKQRMDHVGSSLLELRYANEVIRQHLHEWLRFSRHLEERGLALLATDTETVRQYVARRTAKTSASRSRVLRASVRIFLDTDERGQFRRRVGSPPVTPDWFAPTLTPYLLFVQTHRGLAARTARKYTQQLSAFPGTWRALASQNSTGLRQGMFVSFTKMTRIKHPDARTVPPFGSFSAGPPRRDGFPVPCVMRSRDRDSTGMSAFQTCWAKQRWIASWPPWTDQRRSAGATMRSLYWLLGTDCGPVTFAN